MAARGLRPGVREGRRARIRMAAGAASGGAAGGAKHVWAADLTQSRKFRILLGFRELRVMR